MSMLGDAQPKGYIRVEYQALEIKYFSFQVVYGGITCVSTCGTCYIPNEQILFIREYNPPIPNA